VIRLATGRAPRNALRCIAHLTPQRAQEDSRRRNRRAQCATATDACPPQPRWRSRAHPQASRRLWPLPRLASLSRTPIAAVLAIGRSIHRSLLAGQLGGPGKGGGGLAGGRA